MNRKLTTKAFQTIEKTVRNSFTIKQSYAYQLRDIETGNTMAYYPNPQKPLAWFDKMSGTKQWLEEQRRNPPPG